MGKSESKLIHGKADTPLARREVDLGAEEWLCRCVLGEEPASHDGALARRARHADLKLVPGLRRDDTWSGRHE